MPVFDELNDIERMKAPKERSAEKIERSSKKVMKKKHRSTSVSIERFALVQNVAMTFVAIVVVLAVIAAVYYGITLFLGGSQ